MEVCVHKARTRLFTAALLIAAETWKHLGCPSVGAEEWSGLDNKKGRGTVRRDPSHTASLKTAVPRERSQTPKGIPRAVPFL